LRLSLASFDRAEFNAAKALILACAGRSDIDLRWIAGGALVDEFRHLRDGLPEPAALVPLPGADSGPAAAIAAAASGMASALERLRPDLLIVAGDRSEMLGAVGAATTGGVPVLHVSGGELSFGSTDELVRHALTKLSHLHAVAAPPFRDRLLQMGEEPWRVAVTGDPALDGVAAVSTPSREALESRLKHALTPPVVVFTWHPVTTQADPASGIEDVLAGLARFAGTLVITAANRDRGGAEINHRLQRFAAGRPRTAFHAALGSDYTALLRIADAMVGNSSSGIWEAASHRLPVVDIGARQEGRLVGANVLHVACESAAIAAALDQALDVRRRAALSGLVNPYGDGSAAPRILDFAAKVRDRQDLLKKRFIDLAPC
jgi:UDP-hydrolysing UDP-N-acetyl-D-glucosamine 2-epimerase